MCEAQEYQSLISRTSVEKGSIWKNQRFNLEIIDEDNLVGKRNKEMKALKRKQKYDEEEKHSQNSKGAVEC